MEIKWHGNTSFSFKGEKTSVIINPEREGQKGEIVLSSLLSGLKDVEGQAKVFDWPGEYEIKGVPIVAFEAFTKPMSEDNDENQNSSPTVIFYFEIDGIKCCHLGELGHSLKSEVLKEISEVDVLMVKAGNNANLSVKKAGEIIEAIDPRVLLIMGDEQTEFIKDLSILDQIPEEKLQIKANSLPENERMVLRLEKI